MKYPEAVKADAREARSSGLSVREIAVVFEVSRSTASLWTRSVEFSQENREKLKERAAAARSRGLEVARQRKRERRAASFALGKSLEPTLLDSVAVGLYLGEGTKSDRLWAFTNSSDENIAVMSGWLKRHGARGARLEVSVHFGGQEDRCSESDIKSHWRRIVSLPCLVHVHWVRKESTGRSKRSRTHHFGTCRLHPDGDGAHFFEVIRGQAERLGVSSSW